MHLFAQSSIKKNFAYKSVLTLSNYMIAFITFPYISRVLGVERIGLVNFVDNTVGYFLLFATMGVNLLGVREIAAVKDNPEERNQVFSKILGLNLLFTTGTLLVYFILVTALPQLNQYAVLFYIGAAKILCTAFIAEWFFTGIEDFRYITLRSLIIKMAYVAGVFLLVRTLEDYKLYFVLTVAIVILNAAVNTIYLSRFVSVRWRKLLGREYLKQNCILGIYTIMTSMYLTFNVMYLGLVSDNMQVGYYTTAFKVYMVVLGLFSAFTNVMLPRMSALLTSGEQQRFQQLVDKSFRVMCTFSIPMIACSMILAPQIIEVLSGTGYEGAITPMRIIMPAAFFVGIAQILAMQIFAPMKCDKVLFMASMIGAIVSLLLNFALISIWQSIGSAFTLLCAEIVVTTIYWAWATRRNIVTIPFRHIGQNMALAVPCIAICRLCQYYLENPFAIIAAAIPSAICVWKACRLVVNIA